MHWDYAAILIFLGVVVPLQGRRRVRQLLGKPLTTKADRLRLYASTIASQWLITAVIWWRGHTHGASGATFGLTTGIPERTAIVAISLAVLIMSNQLLSLRVIGRSGSDISSDFNRLAMKIFPQDSRERCVFLFVVITVAICEELIYRGFAQHVFTVLPHGSILAGIVLSAALFSWAHLYQGRRGLITTFIVGMVFSSARAWTGSQIPGMIAHFIADFIAGFFLPIRLQNTGNAS